MPDKSKQYCINFQPELYWSSFVKMWRKIFIMKINLTRLLFWIIIFLFFSPLTFIFIHIYSENKDTEKKQIVRMRNKLFDVFLNIKKISTAHNKIEHFKQELEKQNFSNFSLNNGYLCFFKEQQAATGKPCLIVIFIEKCNPAVLFSFLVNYQNIEVSYFNSEGTFFLLKNLNNDLLKKTNNKDIIKHLSNLIFNQKKLKKISIEQLMRE
jgi:hypothetical protein